MSVIVQKNIEKEQLGLPVPGSKSIKLGGGKKGKKVKVEDKTTKAKSKK